MSLSSTEKDLAKHLCGEFAELASRHLNMAAAVIGPLGVGAMAGETARQICFAMGGVIAQLAKPEARPDVLRAYFDALITALPKMHDEVLEKVEAGLAALRAGKPLPEGTF